MDVDLPADVDGRVDIVLNGLTAVTDLSEHDLRDLEFALAQRRAMSRRCGKTGGEHTCGHAPGHVQPHVCRACTVMWSGSTMS